MNFSASAVNDRVYKLPYYFDILEKPTKDTFCDYLVTRVLVGEPFVAIDFDKSVVRIGRPFTDVETSLIDDWFRPREEVVEDGWVF